MRHFQLHSTTSNPLNTTGGSRDAGISPRCLRWLALYRIRSPAGRSWSHVPQRPKPSCGAVDTLQRTRSIAMPTRREHGRRAVCDQSFACMLSCLLSGGCCGLAQRSIRRLDCQSAPPYIAGTSPTSKHRRPFSTPWVEHRTSSASNPKYAHPVLRYGGQWR